MKIGLFTDTFYPTINGVSTSIFTLSKELSALGHKVYIFAPSHPKANKIEQGVFRVPSMPFYVLKSHRIAASYSLRTFRTVRALNLDLIHTQTEFSVGTFGKACAKALSLPIVHTYHTMYEDYCHYAKIITPKMAKKFSQVFCNTSDYVIAPTEKAKNSLISYKVSKQIAVIPTGVNLKPFKKESFTKEQISALKKENGISENDKVVLFIGRLAKEKSLDVIIKAMPTLIAKIPNAKLAVVGDGPYADAYKSMVSDLHLEASVLFLGEKQWQDIGIYYQLGDVFVSASVTETQGLTFTEAMAGKIPVVAKRDESVSNLIFDNVTGVLFDNDDELSDKLYDILLNENKRIEIAENAYKRITPYSSELFALNIEKIYRLTIDAHDKKPKKHKMHFKTGNRVSKRVRRPIKKMQFVVKKRVNKGFKNPFIKRKKQ